MQKCDGITKVVGVASDKKLKEFCEEKRLEYCLIDCDENDVYFRYLMAAKLHDATHLIRWTSDCHLLPFRCVSDIVQELKRGADYVSNTVRRTFPEGMDLQGCSMKFYEWVAKQLHHEKEHPFFNFDMNRFLRVMAKDEGFDTADLINPLGSYLLSGGSIDTQEDLERMRDVLKLTGIKIEETQSGVAGQSQSGLSTEGISWDELETSHTVH